MSPTKSFPLTRYFSILSLVLVMVAGGALGFSARNQASKQMVRMAEVYNENMSQVFVNELWHNFAGLVNDVSAHSVGQLKDSNERLDLWNKTAHFMGKSTIIEVTVFNRAGQTIFSTNQNLLGMDLSGNPAYRQALIGHTSSQLTHRDVVSGIDGPRENVDVLESYIPVQVGVLGPSVIELQQDVTPFVQNLNRILLDVIAVGAVVMLSLYFVQLIVVRYAQSILRGHETRLVLANKELDKRVEDRTRELAVINQQLKGEIAERRRAEALLEDLAHHDPLTGLPNRLMFSQHLARCVSEAERHQYQFATLFIDLDQFKDINDTLGHSVGDELLIEISNRLAQHLRAEDLLARLGGDEFICVLNRIEHADVAGNVATKLIDSIAQPLTIREHELTISASIGISLYPDDGTTPDNLLRAADTAMYQAKKHGRNTYHFHTAEMTEHARLRTQLERLLRQSIAYNELEVHYQIKMSIDQPDQPSGVEALVRWNSPELGSVPPGRFIPIAEETGFVVPLGEWVLRTACQQVAQWRALGIHIPKVSVNLSVRQLERDDILEVVHRALSDSGLPPEALELEITESVIMKADDAIKVLQQLNDMGVQLSVDDFGTGYSSLAYLRLLPIHTLKIDRSFVIGIGVNQGDESIIRAVIGLARSLGLVTVAEGVETAEQLAFLRTAGCNQIQGYYFGKPMSVSNFTANWPVFEAGGRQVVPQS